MIQWLTTVAPPTTASSSSSSSSSSSVIYSGTNAFFSSSSSRSGSTSVSASWNWSQTSSSSGTTSQFASGQTVSQTNSQGSITAVNTTTTSNATSNQTPTTINRTNFRSVQTSTTVSAAYTEEPRATVAQTFVGSQWTTSEAVSGTSRTVFFVSTSATSSRLTTATASSASSQATTTTTLSQTEVDPSYYATVYQTAAINEILWFLDSSSSAAFNGQFSAATELASSGTRFTAMPWSQTSQAGVVNQSATGTSFSGTTLQSTFTVQSSTVAPLTFTSAIAMSLPMRTQTQAFDAVTISQSTQGVTMLYLGGGTMLSTKSDAAWFVSSQIVTAFAENVFRSIGSNSYQALWPKLTSTTYRQALGVITTRSESGSTAGAHSSSAFASLATRAANTYAPPPQGLATPGVSWEPLVGSDNLAQTFAPAAVAAGNGNVALFYDSPVHIGAIDSPLQLPNVSVVACFASESRNITTAYPDTYLFSNGITEFPSDTEYDEESVTHTQTGILSISGLSCSATSKNTSDAASAAATTTSFVIQPQGGPQVASNMTTKQQFLSPPVGLVGGDLGVHETAMLSLRPGVYRATHSESLTSTFSTTGIVETYTAHRPTSCFESVTFLSPNTQFQSINPVSPIVWTATRNNIPAAVGDTLFLTP